MKLTRSAPGWILALAALASFVISEGSSGAHGKMRIQTTTSNTLHISLVAVDTKSKVRVMEINRQVPLVARKQIFIQAPPQTVWNIHTDINNWSTWQPSITAARLESPLTVGSIFSWKSGGLNVTSTIQLITPNQEIAWTGRALGAHARHIWRLTPQNNGTLVTTEESMEGWSISLMKLIKPKLLDDSLDTWLLNLKTKAEKEAARAS